MTAESARWGCTSAGSLADRSVPGNAQRRIPARLRGLAVASSITDRSFETGARRCGLENARARSTSGGLRLIGRDHDLPPPSGDGVPR